MGKKWIAPVTPPVKPQMQTTAGEEIFSGKFDETQLKGFRAKAKEEDEKRKKTHRDNRKDRSRDGGVGDGGEPGE